VADTAADVGEPVSAKLDLPTTGDESRPLTTADVTEMLHADSQPLPTPEAAAVIERPAGHADHPDLHEPTEGQAAADASQEVAGAAAVVGLITGSPTASSVRDVDGDRRTLLGTDYDVIRMPPQMRVVKPAEGHFGLRIDSAFEARDVWNLGPSDAQTDSPPPAPPETPVAPSAVTKREADPGHPFRSMWSAVQRWFRP